MKLRKLLFEQVAPPQPQQDERMGDFAPQVYANNSLDQKVDRYLIRYEKESIPTASVYESVLWEQELDFGDEEPEEGTDEGGEGDMPDLDLGGEGASDSGGDSTGDSGPVMRTPRIDINNFAAGVARLVENFESLLDPRTTIMNRARTYLLNNYNEAVANQLMEILQANFGLSPELPSEQVVTAPPGTKSFGDAG